MSFLSEFRHKNPAERFGVDKVHKWLSHIKNPQTRREVEQAILYQERDEKFGKEHQSIRKRKFKPNIDRFIGDMLKEMINSGWSLRDIEKFVKQLPKSKSAIYRKLRYE